MCVLEKHQLIVNDLPGFPPLKKVVGLTTNSNPVNKSNVQAVFQTVIGVLLITRLKNRVNMTAE